MEDDLKQIEVNLKNMEDDITFKKKMEYNYKNKIKNKDNNNNNKNGRRPQAKQFIIYLQ
jgi:hypothetical protein